jgi:long-chain acyl-CoA synthetase
MKHYLSILKDTICAKWENPALSDYNGKTYTFAHIATDIKRIHAIFAGLGVQPGDKVAVAAKNSAHWAITFLATTTYRAVVVPILNDFLPTDIATLTDHSESVVLFTEAKMWDNMPLDKMPKLKAAVNTDDFSALYSREEGLLESIIEENNKHIPAVYSSSLKHEVADYTIGDLDDLAVINYTSGTTSSPKGVMLTSRNISSNIEFALNRIPVKEGDTLMSMLPMAHMYGMAFEFIYPLCGGAHVYFLGKTPTPTILLKALSDIKPYLFITVPLVLEKIFKGKVMPALNKPAMRIATAIPGVRNLIYGKVRKTLLNTFGGNITSIVVGGAAINPQVEEVMRKVGLPYTVGYGMTECAPLIGYEPWETFCPGSAGRAVDNIDVRIDSADPTKVVGEIQVKGDNVMQGYYKNPEATAAVFTEDGYLRTGDLGIIDAQGNIFIRGRSKCMILTANGQNIYPEELESKLNSLPYVAESLIVERDKRLYALVAIAENTDGMSKDEIAATMEQNRKDLNKMLPGYSQVVGIEILEEGFEHTPKRSIKRFLYK